MELIRPYMEKMVLSRGNDWSVLALETTKKLGVQLLTLPNDLKKLLDRLNRGRLEVRSPSIDHAAQRMYALGHQLIWTAFTITSTVLAVLYDFHDQPETSKYCGYAAIFFGVILLQSIIFHSRRTTR